MKVGVIGCGGIGATHYLSLKALSGKMDLEVTALSDSRSEFLEKAAAYFPNARIYREGMELIEKESLDIVHICLPSYLHADYAIAAMEKKMNVFVEKPLCLTEKDAERILNAEKKNGVKAMVGQVVRSFEEYRYLKDAYENGKYGKLKSIVLQRISGDARWGSEDWFHDENKSGSVVMDLHIHDLDFLRYMLGEPKGFEVKASAFENGMINQIVAAYEFEDVFAVAEGVWDISPALKFCASFRACFEEATIVFQGNETPSLSVYKKDGTVEIPELNQEYCEKRDEKEINISDLGPYYTEIKYFAECVKEGKEVKRAPLAEGAKSVNLALQELEAAKKYIQTHQR